MVDVLRGLATDVSASSTGDLPGDGVAPHGVLFAALLDAARRLGFAERAAWLIRIAFKPEIKTPGAALSPTVRQGPISTGIGHGDGLGHARDPECACHPEM